MDETVGQSLQPITYHVAFFSGALYTDETKGTDKVDDGVLPGANYTYSWDITADFAPRDDDAACIPFAYHSHRKSDMEVNTGLIGLLIICKQGQLN